ncbi:MAG: flagellar motor stator protein MotA [Pirellulales bacterium]|nr:flagellar motor stator protein MotA [Pirellulales bacterium]
MITIVGFIVVLGAVLAGFTMAGGHLGALIHPSEFVTIGGAALGSLIVMSPGKVLKDIFRSIPLAIKGTPYTRPAYEDLFKVLYGLCRLARQNGVIALESHISNPQESKVFMQYPRIAKNHHVTEFICEAFMPILEATAKPEQMPGLLGADLAVIEEEHHGPLGVLQKTADALPGFGIVAAVMGIVVTMGAIDGPVEEVGEKVGAALVGTFLGILLSYGFVAPLSVRLEFIGVMEMAFFRAIAMVIQGFATGVGPKVALEMARRGMATEVRISREEMDKLFAEVDAS